jgi:hypothetical protein
MDQLAYLFWHVPRTEVDEEAYRGALARFHATLGTAQIPGFLGSTAWRITEPPWLARPTVYEDWYLLDGFAALGRLNAAAVARPCQAAHDQVAQAAGEGAGGLYGRVWGELRAPSARSSHWFSKGAGPSYPQLMAAVVGNRDPAHGCLWQRQLVLGPAPEFCLHLDQLTLDDEPEGTISFLL